MEMTAIDTDIDAFLEHFGIKGMKWGVVNKDRPTRTEKKQVRREAKAQPHVEKSKELQKRIDALNAKPTTNGFQRRRVKREVDELSEEKAVADKAAQAKREGRLTDRQKKVAIGVGVAAAVVAAYGTHQFIQSGNANRALIKGKQALANKGGVPWKINPELSKQGMSENEIYNSVVKHVNPDYGQVGTRVNCRRCTFAYEMRRRGYDVSATKTTTGRGQDVTGIVNAVSPGQNNIPAGASGVLTRLYAETIRKAKNPSAETPFTDLLKERGANAGMGRQSISQGDHGTISQSIYSALGGQPEGARGELGVSWRGGGAHSLAWEVINGRPVIFDTQNGKQFYNEDSFFTQYGINVADAGFTRLDNIPLNNDFLLRWLKDAD